MWTSLPCVLSCRCMLVTCFAVLWRTSSVLQWERSGGRQVTLRGAIVSSQKTRSGKPQVIRLVIFVPSKGCAGKYNIKARQDCFISYTRQLYVLHTSKNETQTSIYKDNTWFRSNSESWIWTMGSTKWPKDTDMRTLLGLYSISLSVKYSGPKPLREL